MLATFLDDAAVESSNHGSRTGPYGARLRVFAPLGRMAFTNYIVQSFVFAWIFFGYGLGQFGRMGVSTAFLLGITVYDAQMVASALWLRWFRFGPLDGSGARSCTDGPK